MKMPNNGRYTFDQLRKINTDLKIILTNGYAEDSIICELLKQGCDGFFQKPFDLKVLSEKIKDTLKNRFASNRYATFCLLLREYKLRSME